MDEQVVRERVQAFADALKAGDIGRASQEMSAELQRNLGPVVAMLPLPVSEAVTESLDMTGTGFLAVLRLTGESGETKLETRWKDRDGKPTMVEASHLTEEPAAVAASDGPEEDEAAG
ncbi:MAG TPA: hypothetical protein VFK61_02260 [Candidatus Limnocylindria bacterium]|jgi:hypothetical protein|nr:hypothetical protein [Candidatus Limnocylindria bacterium]